MYKRSGMSICIDPEREFQEKIILKKNRVKHKEIDTGIPTPLVGEQGFLEPKCSHCLKPPAPQ